MLAAALHLTSRPALLTEETTSSIAWAVAAASSSSTISEMWVAPSMTRCTLFVDKVAMSFCAADQAALLPLQACREATQRCSLVHRGRRLDVVVDRAANIACGRHAGA